MVCRSIVKPVENPRGIGEVFDKDRLIARVSYNMEVIQEEFWVDVYDTSPQPENLESAVGNITIIDKWKKLHGTNVLTLRLKDNRRLDFRWQRADPLQPKYAIRSFGAFY